MTMKKIASLALVGLFTASLCGSADASWLSKTLDKLDAWTSTASSATSTTTNSDGTRTLGYQKERLIEIGSNQYYTTYLDTKNAWAGGVAQGRSVTAQIIRVYTPLGSQWLGVTSGGAVRPDVITRSVTKKVVFSVGSIQEWSSLYYDVHGNLIYDGRLRDSGYSNGGQYLGYDSYGWSQKYVPYSEAEAMKDKVFHLFGWDY